MLTRITLYRFTNQLPNRRKSKIMKQKTNSVNAGIILKKLSFALMCIQTAPIIKMVVNIMQGKVRGL